VRQMGPQRLGGGRIVVQLKRSFQNLVDGEKTPQKKGVVSPPREGVVERKSGRSSSRKVCNAQNNKKNRSQRKWGGKSRNESNLS